MKDVKGIERNACTNEVCFGNNSCEEYLWNSENKLHIQCLYCGHYPREHVPVMNSSNDKPESPPSPQIASKQLSPEDYVFMVSSCGYTVRIFKYDPETFKKYFAGSPTTWQKQTMGFLKARLYVDEAASKNLPTWAKVAIGLGAAGLLAGGAVLAAPVLLAGAGFTASGVAAGSLAAAWQASIGNVLAGSLFAAFQSAGMAGFGAAGFGAAAGAAAAFGGIAGGIIANGVKIKIPVLKLQEVFDKYDLEQVGYVLSSFLRSILKDLDVNMSDKELEETFKKVTGNEFDGSLFIFYEDFLSMFRVKIHEEKELCGVLESFFEKVVKEKGRLVPDDVKRMFGVLNVNACEKHVEACFEYVLGGQTDYFNLNQFLKLFGIFMGD